MKTWLENLLPDTKSATEVRITHGVNALLEMYRQNSSMPDLLQLMWDEFSVHTLSPLTGFPGIDSSALIDQRHLKQTYSLLLLMTLFYTLIR